MKKRKVSKKENIKAWKRGINNIKIISSEYPRDQRKGIRL